MSPVSIDLRGAPSADAPRPGGPVPVPPARPLAPDRSVRPALVDDAPAIARIQGRALLRLDPAFSQEEAAALEERWRRTLSAPAPAGCWTFVALHANAVAGFALVVPAPALGLEAGSIEEGSEIAELLVDPDFARSGHGSRLLQAIADTSGSATLRIWAGAEDEARLRFLQSAGFAPAGLRRCLEPEGGEPILQHLWWAALESRT